MALKIKHNDVEFGVGDRIRVYQKIQEGEKTRIAFFEGMVIGIKGMGNGKTFTVRRVGEATIGIERIFPIGLPSITEIKIIKKGVRGVRQAKLYYTREKSPKEIEMIYKRNVRREQAKLVKLKVKKVVKKTIKRTDKK